MLKKKLKNENYKIKEKVEKEPFKYAKKEI
jgi:hypothetical protein